MAVVSVAVEVDGIGLVVRTRGVVHEQHVVVFQIPTYKALVERERSVLLFFHRAPVGRLDSVGKFRGRFAQAGSEDAVNHAEHFLLAGCELFAAFAGSIGFAQGEAVFAQFEADEGSHA